MRLLQMMALVLALAGCGSGTTQPTPMAPPESTPLRAGERPTVQRATAAVVATTAPADSTPTARPTDPAPSPTASATPTARPAARYSYPIGSPGRPLGEGFFIRHGYAVENTWFSPGNWHTGEDWYAIEGDTAGALVYAVADGQVIYTGSNYPGRVVLIQHDGEIVSMYGHLSPDLLVTQEQRVVRGQALGRVLRRGDDVPNHLHFEIRTFAISDPVNGASPRYAFRCGVNCPPGPGYWPIGAPEHPSRMGWRNPTHLIAAQGDSGEVVVVAQPLSATIKLWDSPAGGESRPAELGELQLESGTRYRLLESATGAPDALETSALAYRLWYRIQLEDGHSGWVEALAASAEERGADGRPSSLRFNFVPALEATAAER